MTQKRLYLQQLVFWEAPLTHYKYPAQISSKKERYQRIKPELNTYTYNNIHTSESLKYLVQTNLNQEEFERFKQFSESSVLALTFISLARTFKFLAPVPQSSRTRATESSHQCQHSLFSRFAFCSLLFTISACIRSIVLVSRKSINSTYLVVSQSKVLTLLTLGLRLFSLCRD